MIVGASVDCISGSGEHLEAYIADGTAPSVSVFIADGGQSASVWMTPKTTRKLAKALKRLASQAEQENNK